ncbi:hypothetical protein GGI03_001819 [Coemansia sp. RSA 2337]|nr:hypothetical protein GGI08_008905 [Coemansia sp. S2]KAJ2109745.1 hypothetical protein IW146_006220 [Coemansia sp. RSA 922]KAJ2466968.1 hypothetical protein GGI03_001819 [Coemansia sp. RSA 2337]
MSLVLKAVLAAKSAGRTIRGRLGLRRLTGADTTTSAFTEDLSKRHDNPQLLLKLDSADWSVVHTSFFALEDWRKNLPLAGGDHSALRGVCQLSQRLTDKGEHATSTSLIVSMAYILGLNDEELDTIPTLIEDYYRTQLPHVACP